MSYEQMILAVAYNGKMAYATGKEASHMLVEELKMVCGKEINYLNQNNMYKTKKAATTTMCIFISQCVVLNSLS